jgi:SAM-dependent methyltransferase
MDIDFGRTAKDYGTHRAGFPDRFFDTLIGAGLVRAGDRLLDLGTGTGTVARGFARRGCDVTALDPSQDLLDEAERLAAEEGVSFRTVAARAEDTGLDAGTFDVVIAGQCWHWFDRPRAAAEIRRLLRPGGRLVIAYFDWIPLEGNMVAATEALILRHNPSWRGGGKAGIHPAWLADLALGGFDGIETASFDHMQPYSHEAWRGRTRASAGIAASLDAEGVAAFDREMGELLARDFPDDPQLVHHRVWWVTAVSPG